MSNWANRPQNAIMCKTNSAATTKAEPSDSSSATSGGISTATVQMNHKSGSAATGRVHRESVSPIYRFGAHSKQYRLFLLNHAAKCTAGRRCKHARCLHTKQLLKHMASCRDRWCRVPHCASGCVLLNHFHQCKDEDCGVCAPVCEAIVDEYWEGTRRQLSFANEHKERLDAVKRKLTF